VTRRSSDGTRENPALSPSVIAAAAARIGAPRRRTPRAQEHSIFPEKYANSLATTCSLGNRKHLANHVQMASKARQVAL